MCSALTYKNRHNISNALNFLLFLLRSIQFQDDKSMGEVRMGGAAVWLTAAAVPSCKLVDLNARRLQRRQVMAISLMAPQMVQQQQQTMGRGNG
jgi:hypothetical protein